MLGGCGVLDSVFSPLGAIDRFGVLEGEPSVVEGLLFSEGGPAEVGGPGDLLAAVDVAGYGAGGPGMRGPVPGPEPGVMRTRLPWSAAST